MTIRKDPKFRRRSLERPEEIASAALEVFAEQGFGAARLEDVAVRAGVSKGALYLYFADKQDLFRAAVRQALRRSFQPLTQMAVIGEEPPTRWACILRDQLAQVVESSAYAAAARIVAGHWAAFPDLADLWRQEFEARVLAPLVAAIEAAQSAGRVRGGDSRGYALSLAAPLSTLPMCCGPGKPAASVSGSALIQQHVETVLRGMAARPSV